jgi:hypothetical protein
MAKCMQCGGATKMKKMQTGGSMGIVGMPKYSNDPRTDAGRTLKKGGVVKKYQDGGSKSKNAALDYDKQMLAKQQAENMKIRSKEIGAKGRQEYNAKINQTRTNRANTDALNEMYPNYQIGQKKKGGTVKPKMKMGGSSFGMLSVKAGVDKNPNPTAADRIAGAKMKKAKFGTSVKVQHSPAPGRVRSSSGTGTVPVGMRKKKGGSVKK